MVRIIIDNIQKFLTQGHARTLHVKKHIIISFVMRGLSVAIGLILIPLTLTYVDKIQYGIWIALSSIIGWVAFFDIGFGNGLKIKLAEAIALGDVKLGKSYVSTAYFFITILSLSILLIYYALHNFLNWQEILNAPLIFKSELSAVALIITLIFCTQFVLQLINSVTAANQNVTTASVIGFLGNALSLVVIFVLKKYTKGSLIYLCFSIGFSPILVLFGYTVFLFRGKYRAYAPSLKDVKMEYGKSIMHLGVKFFVVQIGLIMFYNVDNVIISRISGPESVTIYNFAFKYFSIITMISGIIMAPFWPAFTEANVRNENDWIKTTIKKLQKVWIGIVGICLVMLLFNKPIFGIWLGESVHIPFTLCCVMAIFICVNSFRTIFIFYMNATGKISIQLVITLIAGVLNVPLGFIFGHYLGSTGVILATTILCVVCGIFEVVQYNKIINGMAKGIWNK
ncbi:lipopolysaccharide biosynthesis protein [Pedobacter sp. GR22-6]|uniref:lipopolysaccharide biosynthesis protein n=1 Tax=Pedobacter sp. GR22-6 TaxID=3127957 RepID=UPI00307ED168